VHRVWLRERARAMGVPGRLGLALNPYHRYTLRAERRLFADPALRAVICNSAMVRAQIRELFGVDDTKLHLIYNAVDSHRFSPALRAHRGAFRAKHSLPADAVVYALVGSGYHRKGVEQAIRALAHLPPAARLVVAGRDKKPQRFVAHAARLGVADRIVFAGPLEDVRPLLGAADAFVLPTLYDPLPNACLEAMAAGLPVVTSTQCGAAELLAPHAAGIACDALDIDALAAAMKTLLDPSTRWAMGERARRAAAPLTAQAMASQLIALYRSLLRTSANAKL
jgi:UDP-glucose:(heptosyl)LPS alpha-1,3-glucosyltransferase